MLLVDYIPWAASLWVPIIVLLVLAYGVLFYRLITRANKAALRILEDYLSVSSHVVEKAVKDLLVSLIVFLSWEVIVLVLLFKYGLKLATLLGIPSTISWFILLAMPPIALAIIFVSLLWVSKN